MLKENFHLGYIDNEKLFAWINENKLNERSFGREKLKWAKESQKEPGFFPETELLLVEQDILLLKVPNNHIATFLAKTYQLTYQAICQNVFREKKNIVIISEDQWNRPIFSQKSLVLLKDEESSKKILANWLAKLNYLSKEELNN